MSEGMYFPGYSFLTKSAKLKRTLSYYSTLSSYSFLTKSAKLKLLITN